MGTSLLGNMFTDKDFLCTQVNAWLLKVKVFNASPSFNQFCVRRRNGGAELINTVFSGNNLQDSVEDGTSVLNLDCYLNHGTYRVLCHFDVDNVIYFDSSGLEDSSAECKGYFVDNGKGKVVVNTFNLAACDSIICLYLRIDFITDVVFLLAIRIYLTLVSF